jgi:transcriptional regulator
MYTPVQFKVGETGDVHALMRAHPFATLITYGSDGLVATHLPTVLKVDEASPLGRIECHLARPNTQWKTFAADVDALMIFQGAEAYIRPGWYPSKAEHGKVVPTWNYAVVHAYGRIEVMDDKDWLLAPRGRVERPAGGGPTRRAGLRPIAPAIIRTAGGGTSGCGWHHAG